MIKVKRYQATNVAEALKLIKADLGPDAIILESQRVRKPGLKGLFGPTVLEVSAVVEPEERDFRLNRMRSEEKHGGSADPVSDLLDDGAPAATFDPTDQARFDPESPEPVETAADLTASVDARIADISSMMAQMQEQLTRLGREPGDEPFAPMSREQERLELAGVDGAPSRDETEPLKHPGLMVANVKHLMSHHLIRTRLLDQDVEPNVVDTVVSMILAEGRRGGTPNVAVDGAALHQTIARLAPTTGPLEFDGSRPEVMVLVGPAGVGKTTTASKLVSLYAPTMRVAFVTAGRSGFLSTSQLEEHARAARVKFQHCQTVAELRSFLDKARGKFDLFLIDTPGISLRDGQQVARIRGLIERIGPSRTHLVVPASLRSRLVAQAAEGLGADLIAGLVFTKMDEVDRYGEILNALVATHLPAAYLAGGQHLSRGLELATSERIAELVIGDGGAHSRESKPGLVEAGR